MRVAVESSAGVGDLVITGMRSVPATFLLTVLMGVCIRSLWVRPSPARPPGRCLH